MNLASNFGQQHCEAPLATNRRISARIKLCKGVRGEATHVQVLPDKEVVIISGKVTSSRPATGNRPGNATVEDANFGAVTTVWWPPDTPPIKGTIITVHGPVSYYNGKAQVTVHGTVKDIPTTEDGRIIAYLRDCTEAEARSDLSYSEGRRSSLLISAPAIDIDSPSGIELPDSPSAKRWVSERRYALTETLLLAFGLIYESNSSSTSWIPLFTAEVSITAGPNAVRASAHPSSFDINPSALKELGLDQSEVDAVLAALRSNPELEEATSGAARLEHIVQTLLDLEVLSDDEARSISFANLTVPTRSRRVNNSAVLIASAGSAAYTVKMLQELTEIAKTNPKFTSGPLSVLFGHKPALPVPTPSANPILVPTSIRQDQAISSAMTNPLTVITGPPGTGKSQVLVNLVNASVLRGESVLFASKNNKAVDVVFDRISQVSPGSRVLRAGAASRRGELASSIEQALRPPPVSIGLPDIAVRQKAIDEKANALYRLIGDYYETERELGRVQRELAETNLKIPGTITSRSDVNRIKTEIDSVASALENLRKPLPWFRRWKRIPIFDDRLESLDYAVEVLEETLNSFPGQFAKNFTSVAKPVPSSDWRRQAANELRRLKSLKDLTRDSFDFLAQIESLKEKISEFEISPIENGIQELNSERIEVGRLHAAANSREDLGTEPIAVAAAKTLLGHISTAASGGSGALAAKNELPKALPVLPAWGVTNLSVGVTFPLIPKLFDLVIIDEASQCDLASAIPLLYRAKRAVIIGDPRQLTHITSIGPAREQLIADRYKLTDAQKTSFSYRGQSLYLAAEKVFGEPIFLNLHFRSHPGIIQFSNRYIYNERLEICTNHHRSDGDSISWVQINGDCSRVPGQGSWFNLSEATAVVEIIRGLIESGRTDIGVVSPYRAQSERIISLLRSDPVLAQTSIPVTTAHKFQGDESDHIIFSPVIGPAMPPGSLRFASDPNLLNVALTRARKTLTIVGNIHACQKAGGLISSLAEYVTALTQSTFDSPLELQLHDALLASNIETIPGHQVAGHRCDLAIMAGNKLIDIECDGQAFHTDLARDEARDAALKAMGWKVIRFSGREISRDTNRCVSRVLEALD